MHSLERSPFKGLPIQIAESRVWDCRIVLNLVHIFPHIVSLDPQNTVAIGRSVQEIKAFELVQIFWERVY